jgi:lantibiotic modifying enzyme
MDRLEKSWKTLDGKLAVIAGKEVIHRIAGWVNKEFGVSINAVKLARELTRTELDEEIQNVLKAIEEGEPFT